MRMKMERIENKLNRKNFELLLQERVLLSKLSALGACRGPLDLPYRRCQFYWNNPKLARHTLHISPLLIKIRDLL